MACLNRMQNKSILINQYRGIIRNFSALANQNKRVNEARIVKIQKYPAVEQAYLIPDDLIAIQQQTRETQRRRQCLLLQSCERLENFDC